MITSCRHLDADIIMKQMKDISSAPDVREKHMIPHKQFQTFWTCYTNFSVSRTTCWEFKNADFKHKV